MSWYIKKEHDRDGNLKSFEVGHYTPIDHYNRVADLSFEVLKSFKVEDERYGDLCWEDKDAMAFTRAASLVSFLNGGETPPASSRALHAQHVHSEDSHWNR